MIRLERRLNVPRWLVVVTPLGAFVVAALIGAVLLGVSGHNPLSTYSTIFTTSFTKPGGLTQLLVSSTPLALTGLAAAVTFSIGIYNIGGEGQLYMGAIGAAGIGIALGDQPPTVVIPAMIAGGAAAGALWALIPALLRAFLNTNEILTSLMLNYVAGLFATYLIFDSTSYWRDLTTPGAKTFPQGKLTGMSGWWPSIDIGTLAIPLGFALALAIALAMLAAMRSTRSGFQLRVMSDAPRAARYAGMRTKGMIIGVLLVSGAIAGVAGASQVGDFSHLLDPNGLTGAAYGYAGIAVAALARFNALGVIVSAILIGALTNAGFQLQGPNFPQGLVGTMEGIILFSVLSSEVFVRYRLRVGRGNRTPDGGPGTQTSPPTPESIEPGPDGGAASGAVRDSA